MNEPSATQQGGRAEKEPVDFERLNRMIDDLETRWRSGQRPMVESYLDQIECNDPTYVRGLVYAEYRAAIEAGVVVDPSSYLTRFPEHSETLSRLFELERELSDHGFEEELTLNEMPRENDRIGPYHFLRILGEGSFARVFLAEHSGLEDRLVVVKVSRLQTIETQLLAKLQHPHIVEVMRRARTSDGSYELICMSFLGGATLQNLLTAIDRAPKRPRSGVQLIQALRAESAPEFPIPQTGSPSLEKVASLSFDRAVGWYIARLAEALYFARSKKVTHGDIKPSNILISASGVPLLFDFNIGVDLSNDSREGLASGTIGYLPPERLRSLLLGARGLETRSDSEFAHEADLYALGLVFLQTVTGISPAMEADPLLGIKPILADLASERSKGHRAFASSLAVMDPGVRPILRRLLSADPRQRYREGDHLAADLDRWIADRPPLHVRSLPSASRFVRRNRRLILSATAVLFTAVLILALVIAKQRPAARSRYNDLVDGQLPLRTLDASNRQKLNSGEITLPGWSPAKGLDNWKRELDYLLLSQDEKDGLDAARFGMILRHAAHLAEHPRRRQEAIDLLDQAIAIEPLSALVLLRSQINPGTHPQSIPPGDSTASAAKISDRAWLDDYLASVDLLPLHARRALEGFKKVSDQRPHLFLARYGQARACDRLGLLAGAERRYRECVELRPNNPYLRLRHASILLKSGKIMEAEEQLKVASKQKSLTAGDVFLEACLKHAKEGSNGLAELIDEFCDLLGSEAQARDKERWKTCFNTLKTKSENNPEQLLAAVDQVLKEAPDDQYFRPKKVSLLMQMSRFDEALELCNSMLKANEKDLIARANRITILARLHPGSEQEFADLERLVHDPRFEELVAFSDPVILLPQRLAYYCCERGRPGEAIAAASLALRVSIDRHAALGLAHYYLARSLAALGQTEEEALALAWQELMIAESMKPGLLSSVTSDQVFGTLRDRLPLLELATPLARIADSPKRGGAPANRTRP